MRFQIVYPALGLLIVALALAGCAADDPSATAINSNQLPVEYAALGNSLTAGFMNSGLIEGGQEGSFPRLIAAQAGWDDLAQPTVASPGIGTSGSALYVDATGAITSDDIINPLLLLRNAFHPVPYNNMGVPGATTMDVLNATDGGTSQSGANSFFDLILRNSQLPPGGNTQFDQVKALRPKVLTLWVGSNDILGGATGGDPVVGVNITPATTWEVLFDEVADSVRTIGAEMVAVGTIPGIPTCAYFTTVPTGIWLTEETDVEYVLLPVLSLRDAHTYIIAGLDIPGFETGTGENVLPSTYTLTSAEADAVNDVIDAYNDRIETVAAARGWAVADIAAALEALGSDPAELNRLFPWGAEGQNVNSAFGLDGVHPSQKGYGYVANYFIEALNETYGTDIPVIDLSTLYNTVGFESSPGFVPPHQGKRSAPLFSEAGRRTLEALPALLGDGR